MPNPPRYHPHRLDQDNDREPWRDPAPSYGYQNEAIRRGPGTRDTRAGLRSRSADPGQSSYGGFSNEDPAYQRQHTYGRESSRPSSPSSGSGPDSYGAEDGGFYGNRPPWRDDAEMMSFATAERGEPLGGMTSWRDRVAGRTDPKGYVRSDERVREIVCEYLAHSGLDVSDVSVDVADGCVTLTGTVADRRAKHRIEDCADSCAGVRDVDNRIRIAGTRQGGGDAPADTAIGGDKE
ncbi:BON domain-containing protein [Achromobacter ruhlandii]|uniref:BON domain-containing protein n=1 Tax=Achromobacter ruhlandii TaxID=72557 RepID=UPI0007BF14C2|nr:BON domain-containing protein [Achromobacter ruhlandii]